MKPTAVIPLMWETWEFRAEDLDLAACRANGVLVLGTDESQPPCDMAPYIGFMGLKLLFDLGLEARRPRILLLGAQRTLGGAIYDKLKAAGCSVTWFGADDSAEHRYETLVGHFEQHGVGYNALIVAEHGDGRRLLGDDGFLPYADIVRMNPSLGIGIVSGNVDAAGLARSGLRYVPAHIRPFGYMSYQPAVLGPAPVLELYAAGLSVGQAMARARRGGAAPDEAARAALRCSPAMDFRPPHAWA